MITRILLLALAGAAGTLCRFGVSFAAQRLLGERFPWGTVLVNLVGCFLFGLVWAATEPRIRVAADARFWLLTGFMGAFTTFSTFSFDTVQLALAGRYAAAIGNLGLQNFGGLMGIVLGFSVGRSI